MFTVKYYMGLTLAEAERQIILQALRHFQNNKTMTANALGCSVRTLDNKLIEYTGSPKAQEPVDETTKPEKKKKDKLVVNET